MSYLCIKPACGSSCRECNCAISPEEQVEYAKRYAYMRSLPEIALNTIGIPCVALPSAFNHGDFLNGKDADDAIDNAMKEKLN